MSAIGAVSSVPVPQTAQPPKRVDRDGDHDHNRPDPPAEQTKGARPAPEHKLNVEA